ncbi:MAG: hypothetical protein PWQ12_967 [Clostridiales bacterium]|jgi:DNA-binding transcriptional ArsR family regulator|nr:hypothetical protein [Clostridiales bacterium]
MRIRYDESFEFITALFAVGQECLLKALVKSKPFTRTDLRFENTLKRIKRLTPKPLLKEIEYFYDLDGIGYILYNVIFLSRKKNANGPTLSEYITAIKKLTHRDALMYIAASNYRMDFKKIDPETIEEQLKSVAETTALPESDRRKRILDFIENPSLLNALIECTTVFYETVYKKIKGDIDAFCTEGVAFYQKIYEENPEQFFNRYLGGGQPYGAKDEIHISFFTQIGLHDYESKWEKRHLFLLGIRHAELLEGLDPVNQIAYYHKVLSDPKRIELIGLISKRPYYGQELASALGLATSTTSYHLNMLMDLNLVSTSRNKKKVYFRFNREAYEHFNDLFESHLLKSF